MKTMNANHCSYPLRRTATTTIAIATTAATNLTQEGTHTCATCECGSVGINKIFLAYHNFHFHVGAAGINVKIFALLSSW